MQKRSTLLAVLVLLGVSVVLAGCPRPHHHRHRPHIPRPHHLSQPQLPLNLMFTGHVSMTLLSDISR